MRTGGWIALAGLVLGASAHASDEPDLSGRWRAGAAKSIEVEPDVAPFAAHGESVPALMWHSHVLGTERVARCADGLVALCYDARNRGILYRGARDFMPRMDGFTPEGVALRHDRLILRYSFR
jgi:hypothetical protein